MFKRVPWWSCKPGIELHSRREETQVEEFQLLPYSKHLEITPSHLL